MNIEEIEIIAAEIRDDLLGRRLGRVFPLSARSIVVDFFPHSGKYLFLDVSRKFCSAYLIVRKLKDLERHAIHPPPFVIELRKMLAGALLTAVTPSEEGMAFTFESDQGSTSQLDISFAGVDPGIAIYGAKGEILSSLGTISAKTLETVPSVSHNRLLRSIGETSLSQKLDEVRLAGEAENEFQRLAKAAKLTIKREIDRRKRLLRNLDSDLQRHGNAEQWKHFGDLILSNISTLLEVGSNLRLIDHFDEDQKEITIPAVEGLSISEMAEVYFRRYVKARNAAIEIASRRERIERELVELEDQMSTVLDAISMRDTDSLTGFAPKARAGTKVKEERAKTRLREAREFLSSDGIEILVGKSARDNDYLTFRIGRSTDLWLHAADYPGSHVIVRIPKGKKVPSRTLIEAAKLAAFYSEARQLPKAAVNYTQKKFVNKPKRSAPGLVRLSSLKTILVEPEFPSSVKRKDG